MAVRRPRSILDFIEDEEDPIIPEDEIDDDPIARHRAALEANPWSGGKGSGELYTGHDYAEALSPALTALSLAGGPLGAAAGMADVEARGIAEGREPEAWERGLGASGFIPGVGGLLRTLGKIPVRKHLPRITAEISKGFNLQDYVDPRLGMQIPRFQKIMDEIVEETPELSSGALFTNLTSKHSNVYNPEGAYVELSPFKQASKEIMNAAGRGDPDWMKTSRHELAHAGDRGGGDAVAGYPGFLTDFLGMGVSHDATGTYGLRMPGERINSSVDDYMADMIDEVNRRSPEFINGSLLPGLWRELQASGRKYYKDLWYSDTHPTELLATMFEDPEVWKDSGTWREVMEILKDYVNREQEIWRPQLMESLSDR